MPASFQQQSRLRKLTYFGLIALIFTVTVVFRKGFLEDKAKALELREENLGEVELTGSAIRLLMTGFAELEDAVEAINRGKVYRYLFKPWRVDELIQVLREACQRFKLERQNEELLDQLRRAGWHGQGPVPWEHEPNRGFLRSLYALGRAAAALGEQDEAERCRTFLQDSSPQAAAELSGT